MSAVCVCGGGGRGVVSKKLIRRESLQCLTVTKSLNMHNMRYVLEWGLSVSTGTSGFSGMVTTSF